MNQGHQSSTEEETEMNVVRDGMSDVVLDGESPPPGARYSTRHADVQTASTRSRNDLKTIAISAGIALVVLLVLLLFVFLLPQLWPNLFCKQLNSPPQSSPLTSYDWNRVETKQGDLICNSEACMRAALTTLDKMNSSVDPCEDFYHYACGKFIKNTKIPDDKISVSSFSAVGNLVHEQLLSLLSEEIHENEATYFKLAKNMFKLCMNTTRIEQQGAKPLLDILDTLGGWPVLKGDDWNADDSWSWTKSMKDFRKLGYSADYFFEFSVKIDWKNTSRRIIHMDQPFLNVSREYLVEGKDNPIVSAYYNSMVDMAVSLGAEEERAKRELEDSLDFEIALARISLSNKHRSDITALFNPVSVKEFQSEYPYTNWVNHFNTMLKDTDIVIDEYERIVDRAPSFMDQLGPLLESTSNRTMANYVLWHVVRLSSPFLTEKLQRQKPQCSTVLSRKQDQEQRQKECLDITTKRLPIPTGTLFIRNHFNDDSRRAALDIVDGVKNAFEDILKKVKWMDKVTRKSALDNLDSMVIQVGYPDEVMDDKKLNEYYKDLQFKPEDSYLNTVLYVNQIATSKKFKKLRQIVNNTDWTTHLNPTIFIARYFSLSIHFSAGFLQGQYFSHRVPNYMNYGAIGLVIGREITHSFDDQGRQYDRSGNPAGLWPIATKAAYWTKSRCMIEKYGNYTEPNLNISLSGFHTLSENNADNTGLKQAYYAYKKWAEENGPEQRLPALDLTPEQMFWLSAAQTWCSVYRPETLEQLIRFGVFSPSQFRIVGSMSNMVEFAKDFNCPAGSPMNPTAKCDVW